MTKQVFRLPNMISVFEHVKANAPREELSLDEILDRIQNGAYRVEVEAIRKLRVREQEIEKRLSELAANNENDTAAEQERKKVEEERKCKKSLLDSVIFAGTFRPTRGKDNCTKSTGLVILDIDKIDTAEIERLRASLFGDEHVIASFLSPSGDGVKILFRVEPPSTNEEDFRKAWYFLDHYVQHKHGAKTDTSGKDISRICFLSYDAELYRNYEAIPFQFEEIRRFNEQQAANTTTTTDQKSGIALKTISKPVESRKEEKHTNTLTPLAKRNSERGKGVKSFEQWLAMRKEQLIERIESTLAVSKGERHNARLRAAYVLGGLLGGGVTLDTSEAIRIQRAIEANTDTPTQAMKNFSETVEKGKEKSLNLRAEYDEYVQWCEIQQVTRREEVRRIVIEASTGAIVIPSTGEEIERGFILDCLEQQQQGDAKLLARLLRGVRKYDHTRNKWRSLIAGVWEIDQTETILRESFERLREMYFMLFTTIRGEVEQVRRANEDFELSKIGLFSSEMQSFENAPKQKDERVKILSSLKKRLAQLGTSNYQNGVLKLTSTHEHIACVESDFDLDNSLIPFSNGVFDTNEMRFRAYSSNDMFSKKFAVPYEPNDREPLMFLDFLDVIFEGNEELVSFVQKWFGLCLTGLTVQNIFFAYGTGANGKSAFFRALEMMLEPYRNGSIEPENFYNAIKAETFLQSKFSTSETGYTLAGLRGARVVVAPELPDRRAINEALLKQLTGGDLITARRPYGEPFSFRPTAKIAMFGNHKPRANAGDYGFFRRLWLVPFLHTIPERQRIDLETLIATFRAERSAIVNWSIEGLKDFKQKGMSTPELIAQATEEYRAELDSISVWLDEIKTENKHHTAQLKDVLAHYAKWCEANGEFQECTSPRELGDRLRQNNVSIVTKNKKRIVVGVDLRETESTNGDAF